jgi:hypothetical protein
MLSEIKAVYKFDFLLSYHSGLAGIFPMLSGKDSLRYSLAVMTVF